MESNKEDNPIESNGLTQRAALIMAAHTIAMVILMFFPFVLVRTINQFDFGVYKQAFQIVFTLQALLNLQVAVSVYYYIAKEPAKKLQIVNNVVVFYAIAGFLVFVSFSIWPGWVKLIFQSGDVLVPYVPLIGLMILISLIATNLENVPIALGDVKVASMLIIAGQFTKAVCMITAALAFRSITAILIAAIIQTSLQIVYMAYYLKRKFKRSIFAFDKKLFYAQIGSSIPFGLGGLGAIVQYDLHNYFVSHYYDSAKYAVYAAGCFELPLFDMLIMSFAGALNPELARYKEEGNYKAIINLWMDATRKLAMFFFPIVAVMFVLREDLIVFLFTSAYKASTPLFAINIFAILIGVAVHTHIVRLFDEFKFLRVKLYLFIIPLTFVTLYIGYKVGGLIGISVGVVSVKLLDFLIQLFMISRQLRIDRSILSKLALLIPIAGSAIAAAIVTVVVMFAPLNLPVINTFGRLVIFGSVFLLIYVLALIVSGAISKQEQLDIKNFIVKQVRRVVPETL